MPELLLSLGVLVLLIYGLRRWISKISSVMLMGWVLCITGTIPRICYPVSYSGGVVSNDDSWAYVGGNGLFMGNDWVYLSKVLLVLTCLWLFTIYHIHNNTFIIPGKPIQKLQDADSK